MNTRPLTALVMLVALTAQAQASQQERMVVPGGAGANRLDADVALLAGSPPGFPGLRLFDQGREVAYLKIQPPAREPKWTQGRVLAVATTKATSGFEADLEALREVDRLRMQGIAAPYLKHVTLEGSGDRSHWTILADTTVFDLPDQNLHRQEIAFAAGSYRYLRVTWDDRTSARVNRPASVEARLFDSSAPAESLRAALALRKLSSEPGTSRYRLELPAPHLPIVAIEVSGGGDMFRNATITEPQFTNGAIAPITLGRARLRQAVRDGFTASDTAIPIAPPSARELDLVIDDGSNPPLAKLTATARFAPQPWIYFESGDGSSLTARYGDPRLKEPHYDLEAARPFAGSAHVTLAHWRGDAAKAPVSEGEPSPLPGLGPAVDRGAFRVARALQDSPRGLVVLPLDADVLSVSRNLADVRIVDAKNRQVPYVVEQRGEPLSVRLSLPRREETAAHESRYRLQLPYGTLPPGTRLVLTTPARVFDRSVRLVRRADERRGRDEVPLGAAGWRSATPELAASPLTFDVPLYGTRAVDLVVNEGDNEPLPLSAPALLLPSYALRFQHPGGELTILYGNSDIAAPRYDIALLASRLLTEPARTIAIAKPLTTADEAAQTPSKYFWIVVAGAALVLLALLARLLGVAMKETDSLGKTPGGGDSPR